ncbi:LemA family protein [compost metagenome]
MNKIKTGIIIGLAALAVILLAVFAVNGYQNKAIALEEQVNSATSDVNVQEKRRVDLIYNLVDVVKQYDKHESETLLKVVEARKGSTSDKEIKEVNTLLSATVEAYPELKANTNYNNLSNELATTENLIMQTRNNYNYQVKEYNRYIRKFPNKQFLGMLGYETQNYNYLNFEVASDAPQNLFGE